MGFNVHPGLRNPYSKEAGLFYYVTIFPTRAKMHRAIRRLIPRENCTGIEGATLPAPGNDGCLGFVYLYAGNLSADVVCHEAGHVAFDYIRRQGRSLKLDSRRLDREERVCYTMGRVAQQMQNGIYEETRRRKRRTPAPRIKCPARPRSNAGPSITRT